MQAGDIVFFRSSSFIGDVICWLSKSEYSHVGLAVNDTEIVEADRFILTRKVPLNASNVVVMRAELTEDQQKQIVSIAESLIGRPYDYLGIFFLFIRCLLNLLLPFCKLTIPNPFNDLNKLWCTELVDEVFNQVGIDLVPSRKHGDVTPADLAMSPLLRLVEYK
jgi:hypothetical protein